MCDVGVGVGNASIVKGKITAAFLQIFLLLRKADIGCVAENLQHGLKPDLCRAKHQGPPCGTMQALIARGSMSGFSKI